MLSKYTSIFSLQDKNHSQKEKLDNNFSFEGGFARPIYLQPAFEIARKCRVCSRTVKLEALLTYAKRKQFQNN